MKKKPFFNIINIDTWQRKTYFDYYYNQVKCTYSITANIDIELLLRLCKEKLIKLYPAMIYILTTAINKIDELRINYNDQEQLGVWDFMSPSYTVLHNDDKTFSNIWTSYDENFSVFKRNYLQDIEKYGSIKDFFAKGQEPGNTFPVSCIPWIDFTGFNLNIYDDARYLCPIFTIGKYSQRDSQTVIPVAVQLHHAICDGYHASLLFELINKLAATPEEWLNF
ncbi:type A chloramphenicol O-acetyltransferase [soil metagenome]